MTAGAGSEERAASVAALLAHARALLEGFDARIDTEVLLASVLGRNRAWLYAHPEAAVDAPARARFLDLLQRRRAGEPLAWLTGRQEFWSLDLAVGPATLVPRPETELLVECALAMVDDAAADVLDLGTGTGAIALALASERPRWSLIGVDISMEAVELAAGNATRLGIGNVRVLVGDWYSPLRGQRFRLIVANPPYVREGDPCLDGPGVRFEPRRALVAGSDGLDALRRVIAAAPVHLECGGVLACEHGAEQGAVVRELLVQAGFTQVFTRRDLAGMERVSGGRMAT